MATESVLDRVQAGVRTALGYRFNSSTGGPGTTASFAGADIRAVLSLPLSADLPVAIQQQFNVLGGSEKASKVLVKEFAELQTISISSTRSISPVRALGSSNPLGYARGARTFAGTMIFASINRDTFREVFRPDFSEATITKTLSPLIVDQLPPFDVVITASNELGNLAVQVIRGVHLVNFGTTYSIDDVFTEVSYTYLAREVTPLMSGDDLFTAGASSSPGLGKALSDVLFEVLGRPYGSIYESVMDVPAKYRIGDIRIGDGLRQLRAGTKALRWY